MAPTLVPRRGVKQYSYVKELRQKYVGAAGGQFVILPYPAALELSGIYETKSARGVDTREVKSHFDHPPSGIETLRLSLESMLFKRV